MLETVYDYIFEIMLQEGVSNSNQVKDMLCEIVNSIAAEIQEEKEQRRFEYARVLVGSNPDRVKEVIKKLGELEEDLFATQNPCSKVNTCESEADISLSEFLATLEARG